MRFSFVVVVAALAVAALFMTVAVEARRPKWHELKGYTFDRYTRDFRKHYSTSEYNTRKARFETVLSEIQAHNARKDVTYRQGVNHLTDRTDEELARMHPNLAANLELPGYSPKKHAKPYKPAARNLREAPETRRRSVDYRTASPPIISAIKDQGYCGSCWAFGSTETLEAHWALATGELIELAPEQLVSCVPSVSLNGSSPMWGCDGYFPEFAMDYLTASNGLTEEYVYPYTSFFIGNGSGISWKTCQNWKSKGVTPISGYYELPHNDQHAVETALINDGPLIALIYVIGSFERYETGVFMNGTCNSNQMQPSHIIQIVGFGHDEDLGVDYWIIRNSWSAMWGEAGYIRLYKPQSPPCGTMEYFPNSDFTNWVANVTACGTCGLLLNTLFPIVEPSQ